MTRVEHVVSPAADVTVRPATPGGHEVTVYDGVTTVVLRFASARILAGFVAPINAYLVGVPGQYEMASTGRWEDQGSAGEPVGESGEGGSVATTRALPADSLCPGHYGTWELGAEEPIYCDGSCVARGGLETP